MSGFLGNIRIATLGMIMSVLLIVTGGAFIATSVFTLDQVGQLGTTWQSFNDGPAKKVVILNELRGAVGYGGMIHNFKNYYPAPGPPAHRQDPDKDPRGDGLDQRLPGGRDQR